MLPPLLALLVVVVAVLVLVTLALILAFRTRVDRIRATQHPDTRVVAFFHPYCSGGGGGERVLWKAVQVLGTMVDEYPCQVVIYTIDDAPTAQNYTRDLMHHVQERFSIAISDKLKIQFVHLHEYKYLLDPSPRLSLLVESLGAMKLAWIGLQKSWHEQDLLPHVFVDTTGCAFTFIPASCYFGCRIVAYVHYPTISTDMLNMVWERRRAAYNHAADIADSRVRTAIKLVYYTIFAVLYGLTGSLASLVMVNSTWTAAHIRFLWKLPAWRKGALRVVYPPCAVKDLQNVGGSSSERLPIVLSIGQFRPEKDHVLQLEAFARMLKQDDSSPKLDKAKLVLIGSCRNDDDQARLKHLQKLAQDLDLSHDQVEFCVNQPYTVIRHWLGRSSVGIHTMWNEHFGIGIVEMMAAGLLVVAHNSGGPRTDIVQPGETGFLAATVEEYAEALRAALTMPTAKAAQMRQAARERSKLFSDEVFDQSFREAIVQAKIL